MVINAGSRFLIALIAVLKADYEVTGAETPGGAVDETESQTQRDISLNFV